MITTTDGRLIPPACTQCHVSSARDNGLCWMCIDHPQGPTETHRGRGMVAGSDRDGIERAKAMVRQLGLANAPYAPRKKRAI